LTVKLFITLIYRALQIGGGVFDAIQKQKFDTYGLFLGDSNEVNFGKLKK
jgi:hypothetical protein